MINPKILILPDIHGRKFYCNALCEAVDKGAEIVCLGDYLDPYRGDDLHEKGVFAPLKELVEVKKHHPDRVPDRMLIKIAECFLSITIVFCEPGL